MEPHAVRYNPLLSPGTGVLLAFVCGAWFVAAMDWIPEALEDDGEAPAWFARNEIAIPATDGPVMAPDTSGNRAACDGCETDEPVRTVEKKQKSGMGGGVMAVLQVVLSAMVGNPIGSPIVPSCEIDARFYDRAKRTIIEAGKPKWKLVDPVWVIHDRTKPVV